MKPIPLGRTLVIAGNWKMNYGPGETAQFFSELNSIVPDGFSKPEKLEICLFPPYLSLEAARKSAMAFRAKYEVSVGAQNAHWETRGAYTGETSGPMLKELGLDWVLIGHSERRRYFGETNATVLKRAESLLGQGFHVILCIGETLEERKSDKTDEVLTRQIQEAIPKGHPATHLVLAYEPVWAIGTGLTATPDQAEKAHRVIRSRLAEKIGAEKGAQTSILYGGSVTPETIEELLACPNVDGALIGGASLKPQSFFDLVQAGIRHLRSDN